MKKLLVVVSILGMASVASADLIFTVDGEPQPDEIGVLPSDEITLDLHLADGEDILQYQLMYQLSNEQAEFLIDGVVFPWASLAEGKINAWDQDGHIISWVEIAASNLFSAVDGPLDLMDGLVIHCLSTADVVLTVLVSENTQINGQTIPIDTVMHTLTIHQSAIPEPTTLALLGLGGLSLLRRRRVCGSTRRREERKVEL
jgi:hypothetical protein